MLTEAPKEKPSRPTIIFTVHQGNCDQQAFAQIWWQVRFISVAAVKLF